MSGSDGGTPSVDLPVGTTSKQLELLINSLLANQESVRLQAFLAHESVITSLEVVLLPF